MLWLGEAGHTAIMTGMEPVVRAARPDDDAAAELLYISAAPYYDRYAGGPARARRILAAVYPRDGHTASWEVCRVATLDGEVVGVLAAFPSPATRPSPAASSASRCRGCRRGGSRASSGTCAPPPPSPPSRRAASSTSTRSPWHPTRRRRGVARALLAEADRLAAAEGLHGVALDTGIENRAARALYQRSGFSQRGLRPVPDERSARAIGGSGFVGYLKTPDLSAAASASATRSTWSSRMAGKNGSASERAATASATGNSPGR